MVNSKLISALASNPLDDGVVAKKLPITAERLRERMDEIGETQEDLAISVGATQGAISQILTGATRNSRFLPKIAHALSVNHAWLAGVTDEKIDMFDHDGEDLSEDDLAAIRVGRSHKRLVKPEQLIAVKPADVALQAQSLTDAEMAEKMGIVGLRELDLQLGMGATFLDVPVTEKIRYFDRDWLRSYTRSRPDELIIAQGIGDSMEPSIRDTDLLLIDVSQRSINMTDKYWAVAYANCGAVKRLRPLADGGVVMLSDNPNVPDNTAYDGEMHVFGRVVAIVRKM